MDGLDSFGDYVRRRRKALDLTQEKLAERVGLSASAIRKIETDSRRPSRQVAELLAECLELKGLERQMFVQAARSERGIASPLQSSASISSLPGSPAAALPVFLTPFVGRSLELSALARLLLQQDCQLVTLLGPGGIGKTRLAVEVTQRLQSDPHSLFPDGAYFVSLAPVNVPEFVLQAIADALTFVFYDAEDQKSQLLKYLDGKQMLLILDNVDHLLDGTGLLSEILTSTPGIKLLATSRERLGLVGEWIFELSGLPIPPPQQSEGLEEVSSVALFLNSARRLNPGLRLDERTASEITRICRIVEGMPLGLELAAAWVRMLSLSEIADEIEQNLEFLETTARDIPPRHRSLRATFDQSWKLLSEQEQAVMRLLTVFRGGFRRSAAVHVARASLSLLSALVDKSLLSRVGDDRYELHELIRQYAAAQQGKDPYEQQAARDSHTVYYLNLLYGYEDQLRNHNQKEALADLSCDIDNLRLAWEWGVERQMLSDLRRAGRGLMLFLELHNHFKEGENLFEQAEGMARVAAASGCLDPADCDTLLAEMQARRAWFSYRQGQVATSLALLKESIHHLTQFGQLESLVDALWYYASACWFGGLFEEGALSARDGAEISRQQGWHWQVANFTVYQGVLAHELGEYEQAERLLRQALSLSRATGDPRLIAFAASFLSRTPQSLRHPEEMRELLAEILHTAKQTCDRYGQGVALERMALLAQAGNDLAAAGQLFEESLALFHEIGDQWSLSRLYTHLGIYQLDQRRIEAAEGTLCHALETAISAQAIPNALDALSGLAGIKAHHGQAGLALEIALHILLHPASTGEAKKRAIELQAKLERDLSPAEVDRFQARLEQKPLETLVRQVLES
jgi:predicted ATPase/transcriptional regulator with XRE-family HTH domain